MFQCTLIPNFCHLILPLIPFLLTFSFCDSFLVPPFFSSLRNHNAIIHLLLLSNCSLIMILSNSPHNYSLLVFVVLCTSPITTCQLPTTHPTTTTTTTVRIPPPKLDHKHPYHNTITTLASSTNTTTEAPPPLPQTPQPPPAQQSPTPERKVWDRLMECRGGSWLAFVCFTKLLLVRRVQFPRFASAKSCPRPRGHTPPPSSSLPLLPRL